MTQPTEYVLGGTRTELERLVAQSEGFATEARWLLDQLNLQPGWRVLDVGCGPIGILDLLAERVGPQGEVVGLEREPRFTEMARALVAERHLANVQIVQAEGSATGLPRESFDLAHERLVLINQPDPAAMLTEMIALVRPGGIVAVEEVDNQSWFCEPPHPAWVRLFAAFQEIFHANGLDPYFGRRLPGLLQAAGLVGVEVEAHTRVDRPGEYRRTHLLALIESLRDKVIARGLLTEQELIEHSESLRRHLEDPQTIVTRQLLFQAWGRKPD